MSEHKLTIDVQKIASAFVEIRACMDILEEEMTKALLKEEANNAKANGAGEEEPETEVERQSEGKL